MLLCYVATLIVMVGVVMLAWHNHDVKVALSIEDVYQNPFKTVTYLRL